VSLGAHKRNCVQRFSHFFNSQLGREMKRKK
jgi:hypothetical protein